MSSYLSYNKNSFAGPRRITNSASERLASTLSRHHSSTPSPAPAEQPPPIPPQSPLRSQNPPPTSPARKTKRRSSAANRFHPTTLGEAPREIEEDEKPPPYTAGESPPSVSTASGSPTANNGSVNGSLTGNAWGEHTLAIAPKPTLHAHPAHRQSPAFLGQSWFQRRGGWGRLLLILLAVVVIIGLAVGLGVGLTVGKRKKSDPAGGAPSNSTAQGFPVGQWSIPVVLQTVDSSCTSNPSTFTCFPYTTYARSPSASAYTFNWQITSSAKDSARVNESLTIGGGDNTFALDFGPTNLNLLDAGMPTERFTFSLPLPKDVQPTIALTSDDARATCHYNNTVLSGALYTRGASNSAQGAWPGTVWINQGTPSGAGTPDCVRVGNGTQIPVSGGGGSCACEWVTGNATMSG